MSLVNLCLKKNFKDHLHAGVVLASEIFSTKHLQHICIFWYIESHEIKLEVIEANSLKIRKI